MWGSMAVLLYQLSLVWGEIFAVSILDEWETILSMCLCTVSKVIRVESVTFCDPFIQYIFANYDEASKHLMMLIFVEDGYFL